MKRIAVGLLMSSLAVAGCSSGGSSGPTAFSLAQQACQTSGAQAASLAARAAKLDPKYQQLANDEAAVAANLGLQSGNEDQNLQGATGLDGTGTGSSVQVLDDCARFAKSLLPGVG